MPPEHIAHLEWTIRDAWTVHCATCGWVSEVMGQGDAYATCARGLDDTGHAAFARQRTLDAAAATASADGVF
jgi:hypothetical protein